MSKVRFNLRPNADKNPYIQLVYRISGDSKKLVIGTKLNVPEKYWNKRAMRVRETKEFPDWITHNTILDRWEDAVKKSMNKYALLGKTPSKLQLKRDVINSLKGIDISSQNVNFLEYFDKFIAKRKQTEIRKSTIQLYTNSRNHLEEYRRKRLHNADLEFEDLDKDFFLAFINYLKETKELNTVHKIIKQIRTVLNDAVVHGVEVNMEFKLSHTQVSFIQQPKIYLSLAEIERIENVELAAFSRLDKVRDLFLIGVWTGLRFGDLIRINADHITQVNSGKDVLRIRTRKTNTFVTIPMKEVVKSIIKKYEGTPPRISEQKFNEYLKELCKLAEINKRVSRIEKGEQVFYQKCDLVSSHICRRSFATNSFKSGIHPKFIMPITGHRTVKQFMAYIAIDEEESVEMIASNPYFA